MYNSKNKKQYLFKLFENIEQIKEQNKSTAFVITDVKEKGFIVKVQGLFAYLPFYFMPWKYSLLDYWKAISKYLIGKRFYGKIHSLNKDTLSIIINAKQHDFKKIKLKENFQYSGVVIHKTRYGLFIDLGFHFDWKYGSFVGMLHKNNMLIGKYEQTGIGDEIKVFFFGHTKKDNKIILGQTNFQKEWFTGELEKLVGTKQFFRTIITADGKKKFYVNDKYKTSLPVNKNVYPKNKKRVQQIIDNLKDNDIIKCEILDINIERRNFISKILVDDI